MDDKKEYYDKLENIGVTFSTKKYKAKKDFSKYQSALLNIDSDKLNKALSKDETQILNAIWRLFILQVNEYNYTL